MAHIDARLGGRVAQRAAIVHEERDRRAVESDGRAVRAADAIELESNGAVDPGRPGHVVRDDDIEIAVAVGVEHAGGGAPPRLGRHGGFAEGETAIGSGRAEVEAVLSDACGVEVGAAVAVDVADGDAVHEGAGRERRPREAFEADRTAGAGRIPIDEQSTVVDVGALRARARIDGRIDGRIERTPLREDEVEPPVAIEIGDRDPAREALGKELRAARPRVVRVIDAGRARDVREGNRRGSRRVDRARRAHGDRVGRRLVAPRDRTRREPPGTEGRAEDGEHDDRATEPLADATVAFLVALLERRSVAGRGSVRVAHGNEGRLAADARGGAP